jgi:tubulin--tyrosine ligase
MRRAASSGDVKAEALPPLRRAPAPPADASASTPRLAPSKAGALPPLSESRARAAARPGVRGALSSSTSSAADETAADAAPWTSRSHRLETLVAASLRATGVPTPPPVDKRPILTLELGVDEDENSVFFALAKLLYSNNAPANGTSGRWIASRVTIEEPRAREVRRPCCIAISGINLFLGLKKATEELVAEAGLVCARVRRNGGQMPLCAHMRWKDAIPEALYTSFPSRIVVPFTPGSRGITLKADLAVNLVRCFGAAVAFSELVPETYILTPRRESTIRDAGGDAYIDQRAQWLRAMRERLAAGHASVWIAKSSHGAKGRDVRIVAPPGAGTGSSGSGADAAAATQAGQLRCTAEELLADIDRGGGGCGVAARVVHVVQLYVARPLLLDGRKFDLRAWVLLTPRLELWFCSHGVARLCSEPYSLARLDSVFAHLSNNCLQRASAAYGASEPDNLLTFDELDARLISRLRRPSPSAAAGARQSSECYSMAADVLPQMHEIVRRCFGAIKPRLLVTYETAAIDAFQIFGFDFMLDEAMRVWLLEVNGAPGVAPGMLESTAADLAETVIYDMLPASRPSAAAAAAARRMRPNSFVRCFGKDEW